MFWNPAGMSSFSGSDVAFPTEYIKSSTTFSEAAPGGSIYEAFGAGVTRVSRALCRLRTQGPPSRKGWRWVWRSTHHLASPPAGIRRGQAGPDPTAPQPATRSGESFHSITLRWRPSGSGARAALQLPRTASLGLSRQWGAQYTCTRRLYLDGVGFDPIPHRRCDRRGRRSE